jgi:hypothetical protein
MMDFVDFAFFDAGPFDRFLDHHGAQVVAPMPAKLIR